MTIETLAARWRHTAAVFRHARGPSSVRIAEKYEQCADELSALATHDYAGISVLISSWLSRLLFANGSPAMTIHLCAVEASQLVTLPEPV